MSIFFGFSYCFLNLDLLKISLNLYKNDTLFIIFYNKSRTKVSQREEKAKTMVLIVALYFYLLAFTHSVGSAVEVVEQMQQCAQSYIPDSVRNNSFFLLEHPGDARNFCACVREKLKTIVPLGEMKYFYPEIREILPRPNASRTVTDDYMRVSRNALPLRRANIDKAFVQNCVTEEKKFNPTGWGLVLPSFSYELINTRGYLFLYNRINGFSYNYIAERSETRPNSGHWYQAIVPNSYVSESSVMNMAIGAAYCHEPIDLDTTSRSLGFDL